MQQWAILKGEELGWGGVETKNLQEDFSNKGL
jgi:hypothetical protein